MNNNQTVISSVLSNYLNMDLFKIRLIKKSFANEIKASAKQLKKQKVKK